jgi:hypothetical protein
MEARIANIVKSALEAAIAFAGIVASTTATTTR